MNEREPEKDAAFITHNEQLIYQGPVIDLFTQEIETPDGEIIKRDVVRHPGAVSVVAVDGDEVILVRQYRAAAGKEMLELPAGKRDVAGEAPPLTAQRELAEEIGAVAGSLELLSTFYNSVGFSDEYSYVFLATDLTFVAHNRRGPEERHMTTERLCLANARNAIAQRRIEDAKTVIGLLVALHKLGY